MEVLQALRTHPAVAWCERMNSGAARMGGLPAKGAHLSGARLGVMR
jgi:hypothetical protein